MLATKSDEDRDAEPQDAARRQIIGDSRIQLGVVPQVRGQELGIMNWLTVGVPADVKAGLG
jgi:hypothetical protein